jgi:hypothetical protein
MTSVEEKADWVEWEDESTGKKERLGEGGKVIIKWGWPGLNLIILLSFFLPFLFHSDYWRISSSFHETNHNRSGYSHGHTNPHHYSSSKGSGNEDRKEAPNNTMIIVQRKCDSYVLLQGDICFVSKYVESIEWIQLDLLGNGQTMWAIHSW